MKNKNRVKKPHTTSKTYLKHFKEEEATKCFYFKKGEKHISKCSPKKLTVIEDFYTFEDDNNEYSLEDFFKVYEDDYNRFVKMCEKETPVINDDFLTFLFHLVALQHVRTDKFRDNFRNVLTDIYQNHEKYKEVIKESKVPEEKVLIPTPLSNYVDMINDKIVNGNLEVEELAKLEHVKFVIFEFLNIAKLLKDNFKPRLLKSDNALFVTSDAPFSMDSFTINGEQYPFFYFPLTKRICVIFCPFEIDMNEFEKIKPSNFVKRINNTTVANAKELVIASNPKILKPYI